MSDVMAYAGSFVVGEPSQITLNDPDQDGDLATYTNIIVWYTPPGGTKIQWPVLTTTPIYTTTCEIDPETGQPVIDPVTGQPVMVTVVNTVVVEVIPRLPLPGCLFFFLPQYLLRRRHRRNGPAPDPTGSGTLSGTVNQPSSVIDGTGVGAGGKGDDGDSKTITTIQNVLVFFGYPA